MDYNETPTKGLAMFIAILVTAISAASTGAIITHIFYQKFLDRVYAKAMTDMVQCYMDGSDFGFQMGWDANFHQMREERIHDIANTANPKGK